MLIKIQKDNASHVGIPAPLPFHGAQSDLRVPHPDCEPDERLHLVWVAEVGAQLLEPGPLAYWQSHTPACLS